MAGCRQSGSRRAPLHRTARPLGRRAAGPADPYPNPEHALADWAVYILRCGDGSLYTGITNDLERRIAAHRAGTASRYTRTHRPVRLAYQEPAADRSAALRREAAIKRLTREAKLTLLRSARRAGRSLAIGKPPTSGKPPARRKPPAN